MKKAFLILGIAALVWSCSDSTDSTDDDTPQPVAECDTITPTYVNDIKPILDGNCAGCHTTNTTAGINVGNYNNAKNAASQSIFMKAIRHEAGAKPMPQGGAKLSDGDIQKLACWIENGFPES